MLRMEYGVDPPPPASAGLDPLQMHYFHIFLLSIDQFGMY